MGIWFKLLWIALRFVIFLSENFGGAVFANIYKHLHDAYLFLCEEELFKWASCVKKKNTFNLSNSKSYKLLMNF